MLSICQLPKVVAIRLYPECTQEPCIFFRLLLLAQPVLTKFVGACSAIHHSKLIVTGLHEAPETVWGRYRR